MFTKSSYLIFYKLFLMTYIDIYEIFLSIKYNNRLYSPITKSPIVELSE